MLSGSSALVFHCCYIFRFTKSFGVLRCLTFVFCILVVQEIELKVPMCCSKCEAKVKDTLRKVPGKIFAPLALC